MKIICKTTLLPAPFVGTRIRIRLDDPASLTWGIYSFVLADGESSVTIDWGDGMVQTFTETQEISHTYPAIGIYEVKISDSIAALRCSSSAADPLYYDGFAPCILSCETNAAKLIKIDRFCFMGARNMVTFNCNDSGVTELSTRCLRECESLSGSVGLKPVTSINSTTFAESPGITELVFSQANYDIISALSGFETQFGALNATISFV